MQFRVCNVNRLLGSGSGHGDAGGICEQLPSTAWTGLEGMDGAKPFLEARGDMRGCSPRSPSTGSGWTRGNTSSPRDHHPQSCTQPTCWSITHKKNKTLTTLEACNTPLSLPSGSPLPVKPHRRVGGRKEPPHQPTPPPGTAAGATSSLQLPPQNGFSWYKPHCWPFAHPGLPQGPEWHWVLIYHVSYFFFSLKTYASVFIYPFVLIFFLVKGTFSHISKSASTPTRQGLHDHPLNDAFS